MVRRLLAAGVLFGLNPLAAAGELTARLDPASSAVTFRLQATLHSVDGTLGIESGEIVLDSETGTAKGSVTIDATSAATGNSKRDKKMHLQVLQSAAHPRMVLRARRFEGKLAAKGESEVSLIADIEVLGHPHEVSIPVRVVIADERFTAAATFEAPYVEWGLKDPSTFVLRVAKAVEVTILARGTVKATGDAEPLDPS